MDRSHFNCEFLLIYLERQRFQSVVKYKSQQRLLQLENVFHGLHGKERKKIHLSFSPLHHNHFKMQSDFCNCEVKTVLTHWTEKLLVVAPCMEMNAAMAIAAQDQKAKI